MNWDFSSNFNFMKNEKNIIPADGLAGLKNNFGSDLMSGFMVALLALPLSLGIAAASDFPNPLLGVLTAIIGGLIVSLFMGAKLTIKGPAAGLIVIVAGSVSAFGGGETGWKLTLGAIVVAAIFQILFGLFKLGKLSDFFPLSAVHGMLAAIGLIIISKQLHVLCGVNPVFAPGTIAHGLDVSGKPMVAPLDLLGALPSTFNHLISNPVAISSMVVGLVSLLIVFGWPMLKFPALKKVPLPLIVLVVAIPLGMFLGLSQENKQLVKVGNFWSMLGFHVSFDGISQTGVFIQYVILFAVIGSLESLLTAKAIDMLDPYKRKTDFNRDLIAVGAGNALAGVLGGLPMISEVARSSANVNNGGKTRWANFFHGLFLLVFVALLSGVIEMIPKAALAALLIGVGFKLAHPKEFAHTLKIGRDQFAVFLITIFFTLYEDLLVGIASGIILEIVLHLINGASFKSLFSPSMKVSEDGSNLLVKVSGTPVFTNFIGLKKRLENLPKGRQISLDFSSTKLIDHTVMEGVHHFELEYAETGGSVNVTGLDGHSPYSEHSFAARKKSNVG